MSMTAKVTRYCTSVTANVNRGGTKKKSNSDDVQHRREHRRAAPEPQARDRHAQQVDHHEIRELEVRVHHPGDAVHASVITGCPGIPLQARDACAVSGECAPPRRRRRGAVRCRLRVRSS